MQTLLLMYFFNKCATCSKCMSKHLDRTGCFVFQTAQQQIMIVEGLSADHMYDVPVITKATRSTD